MRRSNERRIENRDFSWMEYVVEKEVVDRDEFRTGRP